MVSKPDIEMLCTVSGIYCEGALYLHNKIKWNKLDPSKFKLIQAEYLNGSSNLIVINSNALI